MDGPFQVSVVAAIPEEDTEGLIDDRSAVTVRDILRLALPNTTTVVGGGSGLDRPVRWARVIHLDALSLERLEPGDLALASFPLKADSPHALLAGLLQDVAAREISALAVVSPVPPGAQALADAIGIPLLSLSASCRLPEIEKSVIGLIVNRRAELEQRGVQIYRQLAQQTIENRGIEAIIETLAEITAKPVTVEDDRGNLEFFHGPPRWSVSREEVAAALRAGSPAEWFIGQPLTSTSPPVSLRSLAAPGWSRFIAPIVVGQLPVGFLSIIGQDGELDEIDRVAASRAAAVCALEISKRQAINEAEKRVRSDFLDDLFSGRITSEAAIVSRGQLLGFDPVRQYAVVVFDLDTSSAYLEWMSSHDEQQSVLLRQVFGRGMTEELARLSPGALLRLNSESAAILHPIERGQDAAEVRAEIERIRQRVAARLNGMTVSAAIGHLYPRVLDAARAYREAEQALVIAMRLFGPNRTTAFDDLGIYRLLFHLHGTPELTLFYEETLGKIVQHDERHGSELVPTLKTFFASHGNLSKTAELLYLHRNTVSYRLQRIEELSGLHLDDEEDRFRLQLALKLRDLV
ncbi:MAG TPA: helix-turn-helix domain-containing protein [Chloroflexota bacterium]|nr:helix-turn-helix domain-containing protein [Chloroflexota bacterium]